MFIMSSYFTSINDTAIILNKWIHEHTNTNKSIK